jgi:endonuclease/exonuclease/phosphatase (EEP) superfamily protein YafD
MICCAYSGVLDPKSFLPAPFMTLSFMPLLMTVLLLLVIGLIWRRWLSIPIILVSLIISLPVIKLFSPMNTSENALPVPADTTLMLKVLTYNVLAFNYNEPTLKEQPSETMRLILDANPDVVVMQEASANGIDWKDLPSLKPFIKEIETKYPFIYYSNEGLSLMSKFPFTTVPLCEPEYSRSVLGFNRDQYSYLARAYDLQLPRGKQLRIVDFRFQSYHLSFGKGMNVRISPEIKPSPLERMRRSFVLRSENAAAVRAQLDASPANLIVCGDMNDVPTSHVYRVLRGHDLHDAWGDAGRGYAYTYNRHGLRYRIDHVFYRGDLRALHADRLVGGSSDHYPLLVTFDIDNTTKKSK